MRVDRIGLRTWLLAVLAGWALLVWLLALAGMGGRIAPVAPDPARMQRLPALPPPPPERIGPLGQYAEIGARPLFSENRRPQPFVIAGAGEGEAGGASFDFVLSSVLLTPSVRLAILQPSAGGEPVRVREGEAPKGAESWRLVSLEPRAAVFVGPEGERRLELRLFDGRGGQAPAPQPPVVTETVERPGPQGPAEVDPGTGGAAKPEPAPTPAPATAAAPTITPEQQMEAIRRRIEARRAQLRAEALRQQQQTPPPVPAPKPDAQNR
ncbi:general secretion pathway protein GspN [Vulcaniibacterium gelatinicum]|uniref:general secretion pathway protein GspN n=1 Tax=Vulcaniibacterium gelatinicum TaxID=2598725 RepID=UPI0011CCC208|nr:general secretion pathway protein GspN [Vulcaniibacterium gelatinicum]